MTGPPIVASTIRRLSPTPSQRPEGGGGFKGARPPAAVPPAPVPVAGSAVVEEDNPVVVLLREAGLSLYIGLMLRNGFDDMDSLMEISDADMRELGIPVCHAVRLRKKLQKLGLQTSPERTVTSPVVAFLRDVGLCRYTDALLANGFDDLDTLAQLTDADARDLGIMRGHALKLRRRLAELRGGHDQEEPGTPSLEQTPSSSDPRAPLAPAPVAAAPLSEQTKTNVERSWERIQELGHCHVGEMLYRNLFEMFPAATAFFPEEVRHRHYDWEEAVNDQEGEMKTLRRLGAKVVSAIGNAVAGLHDIGRLVPMLTQLGMRHGTYGAAPEHWQMLGKALHRTLQQCLGDIYTPEVALAWTNIYAFISAIMIQGLQIKPPADGPLEGTRLKGGEADDLGDAGEGGRGSSAAPFLALTNDGADATVLRRQQSTVATAEENSEHLTASGLSPSGCSDTASARQSASVVDSATELDDVAMRPGTGLPVLLGAVCAH